MTGTTPGGRIAGIDYGTVRVGIALADASTRIASPLENYTRRTPDLDAEFFRRLIARERIDRLIVGLPVHADGGESAKSVEVRGFGRWLAEVTGLDVVYFDERYTTVEADELLREVGLTAKQRKARLDKLAAQIMLAAYLERAADDESDPQPLDD